MPQIEDELKPKVADMLEKQRAALARELDALDLASEKAITLLNATEKYDLKVGSHLAWLAKQRAEVVSHLRQLEKHDRAMTKTPEQRFSLIKAYLRTEATPMQLAEVATLVSERTEGRSVLS